MTMGGSQSSHGGQLPCCVTSGPSRYGRRGSAAASPHLGVGNSSTEDALFPVNE